MTSGVAEHVGAAPQHPRREAVRVLLLVTAIVAVVFAPALFGDYVYDDEQVIQRNADLQAGDLGALLTQPFFSDQSGYWRPVTMLVYWLGLQFGGAAAIHALAMLAHALAGWACFLVARSVFGNARPAIWAAVFFAVHPVQVESVAWCSAIPGILAGVFSLLSIHAALRWRAGDARPWWVAVWLLLALLSKEAALATVPMLVLCGWRVGDQRSPDLPKRAVGPRPSALQLWGATGLGLVAWALLRAWVLPQSSPVPVVALDLELGSLATTAWLLVRQIAMLVWPWPLTPFHPFAESSHWLWLSVAIVPMALLATLLVPRWRPAFSRRLLGTWLAAALVVLPLLPAAIMHRTVGDYPLAERHAYLSVFGLGLVLAPVLVGGARRWLAWLGLLALVVVSCRQTLVWHDQRSLVAHGLRHADDDPLLHVMMANLDLAAAQSGDDEALPRAFEHYQAADRLAVHGVRSLDRKAYARARLGLAWCEMIRQQRRNRVDSVGLIQMFEGALQLREQDASAWVGLGVANALAGRASKAEQALRKALELDPRCTEAWFNLGNLQANLGQRRAARVSLRQALRCQPDLVPAQQLLERLR